MATDGTVDNTSYFFLFTMHVIFSENYPCMPYRILSMLVNHIALMNSVKKFQVKHMHWYGVGDKVSIVECRCSRARLPPSK
jgi:hypothetical protein